MKYPVAILWLFLIASCQAVLRAAEAVWLPSLDSGNIEEDWGKPPADQSVGQHKLSIDGPTFEHGFGTHANSEMVIDLDWHRIDTPHASEMADAFKASGWNITDNLSNRATFETADAYAGFAQCWRTMGDIQNHWHSVNGIGFSQYRWTPFGGPGHWNDPDMLVVGYVGWGSWLHSTHLTPDEQYTHISLWCLPSAPLPLGCDRDWPDDFTLSLLTNDEVLDIDQDSLGRPVRCVLKDVATAVYAKGLEDGSSAVGLFNLGKATREVRGGLSDPGINGPQRVRDLWRQQDLGTFGEQYAANVRAHRVVLARLTSTE